MKKILFVFTGGTIGSTVNGEYICTDDNKPYKLIEGYKKRFGDLGDYETVSPYTLLSENLDGVHICKLISTVKENLFSNYSGIIVTHGTDTLAYSAAALSYALGEIQIPVCLVSAHHPLEDKRSNGYNNLHGAISFIKKVGKGGVWVSYKNEGELIKIHKGTRICNPLCFSDSVFSVKNSFYGYFDNNEFILNKNYSEKTDEFHFGNLSKLLDAKKSILRIESYPEMKYPVVDSDVKYILLGSYHSGTTNTVSKEAMTFFEDMKKRGVTIFITGVGTEIPYESTKLYDTLGIVPIHCISPISAYIKLWFLCSLFSETEKIKNLIIKSLCGDVTE